MRVKKLELLGFKSFAQKTTVHFESGVTAMVGPNGSGKSNIVDSIRWVLGEHNPRDVRAPRLEDVIFNGTDQKAPLSMAEVGLTINNDQGLLPIAFTEVTVTRRVYRSGESECFINQSPCRLKDIQELFLGTGLGGGTYAIIEQGHIDLILSSKPEERRRVFEEASGIAKYLSKKQETMRRLDEVEEHLVRIADIIGEVRRQVSALERAANKARQYKAQWDALKALELRLAVDELTAGASRYQELESRLGGLAAERDGLEGRKQGHMTELSECNTAVSSIQQQLHGLQTRAVSCASQIEQHDSQLGTKTRWIEALSQQVQQADQEILQQRARLSQLDEQAARVQGGEVELRGQLTPLRGQLDQGPAELSALEGMLQTAARAADEAKAQLFEAASEASHQRNQLAELTSRFQALEAQLARLDSQRAHEAAQREAIGRQREALQRERDGLRAQYEEIQRRLTASQQARDAAQAQRHECVGRLAQLRDQVASERAQVNVLEELWQRYEGFPEAVKALMTQPLEGLIGPLVDLIQATPGYDAVVEAALGPLAEALVVRDRRALQRCRELLSSHQLESCRFLVLADCPERPAMQQASVAEGVRGAVKEFVRAEAPYQPLVDWLLNDSWLIDDIERLLAPGPAPESRFVTERGDRWDRRSWRFGRAREIPRGSAEPSGTSGIRLGRRQRLEQARARLEQLEREFAQLEEQARMAEQRWQALLAEQESAKGELAHISPALNRADARLAQTTHEGQRLEEAHRARELELQELAAQRDEARAALGTLRQAVEAAESRQRTLNQSLADAQSAREAAQQRRQELLVIQAQVEAAAQSLTDRLLTLERRRQELGSDREALTQQIAAKTAQRQGATERAAELSRQLDAHQQDRQRLHEEQARVETDAVTVSQSLREAEAKRDTVLPHLLAVEQRLSALMQLIQEHTQQLSERTFRRSHIAERLRELYQIDEATLHAEQQAKAVPLTEEQRAALSEQAQTLRSKLEGIGPVSLGSVEEYDELKRRLEFLQTQQQDLTAARDDLKASISQINRTARVQFRETFARITQEFQHYFTRLFNGGEADLILLDESDVLESGIDIVARPPGKRLQSISLLSGGERALTAVALLFALFKVRPSPFCILDEIDAPLDEANVDRFTRVLEEFLALSQFILITHNKKTITKADSIYGVTMEEPGISKILSAKLTKPDQPAASPAPVAA